MSWNEFEEMAGMGYLETCSRDRALAPALTWKITRAEKRRRSAHCPRSVFECSPGSVHALVALGYRGEQVADTGDTHLWWRLVVVLSA